MSLQQSRQMLRLAAGAILFAAVVAPLTSAASVKVVVPNAYEFVESDRAVSVGNGGGFLYQQLSLASEFASLPATHRMITGVYFRPDASVTQPGSATYDDLRIRISTTTKGNNDLETVLANNHGADLTTVFDGSWAVSTQATGLSEGPRDLDIYFPYDVPFFYDPAAGNLLIESESQSGAIGEWVLDGFTSASPQIVNRLTGELVNGGFVRQFEFIPEPSSLLLGTLCVIGFIAHHIRRHA